MRPDGPRLPMDRGIPFKQAYRADLAAGLLLVGLGLLFFWRYLAPVAEDRVYFAQGDFSHHYYVYRALALEELRQGRWPLWIPCVFSGYPFQADPQSALFYPPVALNLLTQLALGRVRFSFFAFELEAIVHILAASLFTYAFLRSLLPNRWAAVAGSIVFAYGGYMSGYPPLQIAIVEGAVWLPLVFLALRRLAHGGGVVHIVWSAIACAMTILAGNPQTYIYVIYAGIAYYLYLSWRERSPWGWATLRLGAVLVLAAALSSAQLVPSLEYAQLSTRASLSLAEAGTGFPPQDLLQFLVTGLVSHFHPLYVGILPLLLVGAALVLRRGSEVFFWAVLALVALILSFGANLFGYELTYLLLPPYSLFRSQERHALLVSFALAVLTAYGFGHLSTPLARGQRRWLAALLRWLRGLLPWAVLALGAAVYLQSHGLDFGDRGELAPRVGAFVLFFALGLGALYLRWSAPRLRGSWAVFSLALITVDLFSLNRSINYASPYALFPSMAILEPLKSEAGLFRVQDDYRLEGHTACMNGLKEVWGIASIKLAHYDEFMQRAPEIVRWRALAVRYLVTWRGQPISMQGQPVEASLLYQEGEGSQANYLYRLEAPPRGAWVVRDVRVAQDADEVYALLNAPNFDPWRTAVLTEPLPFEVVATDEQDQVQIAGYSSQRIEVSARLATPGLLMLSEVTYPGWRAQVDDRDVRIYQADAILRAIPLEAGEHRLVMTYEPASLRLGILISATALAGLVAWFVISVRSVRSTRPPSRLP